MKSGISEVSLGLESLEVGGTNLSPPLVIESFSEIVDMLLLP